MTSPPGWNVPPVAELDRAALAEGVVWDYEIDWLPRGLEIVDRADLLMWRRTEGPRAERGWANRVCYVRTTPARADAVIDEALAFFGTETFTWVVGPTSAPADLATRLGRHGLVDGGDGDLLTAELPLRGLRRAAGLEVAEVEDERLARIGLRLAHPDAARSELEALLDERMAYLQHPARRGGFLVAFIGGVPVANAGYRYSADGRTVYLSGAETVDAYRSRGVYQSLVAHRADAAVRRGCRYAAIRARRNTSLPILLRRGFIDHGHLPIFTRAA